MKLSSQMSHFLNTKKSLTRTEVNKKIWDYVVSANLIAHKSKRVIVLDDKMKALFGSDREAVNIHELETVIGQHLTRE